MSKIFVRTLATDQIINADVLNEILVRNIVKVINGGLTNYNFGALSGLTSAKILDKSIKSRKMRITEGAAHASSNLVLTVSYQDIPGATVTFTPATASTVFVIAFFSFSGIVTSDGNITGVLDIDGSTQTGASTVSYGGTDTRKLTIGGCWSANLTAASHTLKLQAKKSGGVTSTNCSQVGTTLFYKLFSQ